MNKRFQLDFKSRFYKRSFDLIFAFLGLIFTFPVIFIAWIVATVDTKSNGFFIQSRVGKDYRIINIIKIKTMKELSGIHTTITTSNDLRITKSGAFFRKTKIDELPQLWNVLIGDMSFVGPRPDVQGYADLLEGGDRMILSIRPGITGPASIKYRDEELILSNQSNPKKYNDEVIWPDKIEINKRYVMNYSLKNDLIYIWKTIAG